MYIHTLELKPHLGQSIFVPPDQSVVVFTAGHTWEMAIKSPHKWPGYNQLEFKLLLVCRIFCLV